MSKLDDADFATGIFIKALAARLDVDQGVIVHHDDQGYIVYKNVKNKTLGIQEDERFLQYEHGTLVTTGVSKLDVGDETTVEPTEPESEEEQEIYTKVEGGPTAKIKLH